MLTAADVIKLLGLKPLPGEGGYFVETYRATHSLHPTTLSPAADHAEPRSLKTAIYYLITPESFSALHRVRSDELFHFYAGDAAELMQIAPDGAVRSRILGVDLQAGQRPQALVPAGVWQGLRLIDGGEWALLGTTVAPGFDFADFELGDRMRLIAEFPRQREAIERFTRG